jgi:hypothetical protein
MVRKDTMSSSTETVNHPHVGETDEVNKGDWAFVAFDEDVRKLKKNEQSLKQESSRRAHLMGTMTRQRNLFGLEISPTDKKQLAFASAHIDAVLEGTETLKEYKRSLAVERNKFVFPIADLKPTVVVETKKKIEWKQTFDTGTVDFCLNEKGLVVGTRRWTQQDDVDQLPVGLTAADDGFEFDRSEPMEPSVVPERLVVKKLTNAASSIAKRIERKSVRVARPSAQEVRRKEMELSRMNREFRLGNARDIKSASAGLKNPKFQVVQNGAAFALQQPGTWTHAHPKELQRLRANAAVWAQDMSYHGKQVNKDIRLNAHHTRLALTYGTYSVWNARSLFACLAKVRNPKIKDELSKLYHIWDRLTASGAPQEVIDHYAKLFANVGLAAQPPTNRNEMAGAGEVQSVFQPPTKIRRLDDFCLPVLVPTEEFDDLYEAPYSPEPMLDEWEAVALARGEGEPFDVLMAKYLTTVDGLDDWYVRQYVHVWPMQRVQLRIALCELVYFATPNLYPVPGGVCSVQGNAVSAPVTVDPLRVVGHVGALPVDVGVSISPEVMSFDSMSLMERFGGDSPLSRRIVALICACVSLRECSSLLNVSAQMIALANSEAGGHSVSLVAYIKKVFKSISFTEIASVQGAAVSTMGPEGSAFDEKAALNGMWARMLESADFAKVFGKTAIGGALWNILSLLSVSSVLIGLGVFGDLKRAISYRNWLETFVVDKGGVETLLQRLLRFVQVTASKVYDCYQTGTLSPFWEPASSGDWLELCTVVCEDLTIRVDGSRPGTEKLFKERQKSGLIPLRVATQLSNGQRVDLLRELFAEGGEHHKRVKAANDVSMIVTIAHMLQRLTTEIYTLENQGVNGAYRVEPFAIFQHGAPGTGKTVAMDHLHQSLGASRGLPITSDTLFSYVRGTNFWDGFTGQWCIALDDIDRGVGQPTMSDQTHAELLMNIVNRKPLMLEQASVEQKGKMYANFQAVFYNTNFADGRLSSYTKEPMGFWRRFAYKVHFAVLPQYATASGRLDPEKLDGSEEYWSIVVSRPNDAKWDPANPFTTFPFEPWCTFCSMTEYCAFLQVEFNKKIDSEVKHLAANAAVVGEKCSKCYLPKSRHGLSGTACPGGVYQVQGLAQLMGETDEIPKIVVRGVYTSLAFCVFWYGWLVYVLVCFGLIGVCWWFLDLLGVSKSDVRWFLQRELTARYFEYNARRPIRWMFLNKQVFGGLGKWLSGLGDGSHLVLSVAAYRLREKVYRSDFLFRFMAMVRENKLFFGSVTLGIAALWAWHLTRKKACKRCQERLAQLMDDYQKGRRDMDGYQAGRKDMRLMCDDPSCAICEPQTQGYSMEFPEVPANQLGTRTGLWKRIVPTRNPLEGKVHATVTRKDMIDCVRRRVVRVRRVADDGSTLTLFGVIVEGNIVLFPKHLCLDLAPTTHPAACRAMPPLGNVRVEIIYDERLIDMRIQFGVNAMWVEGRDAIVVKVSGIPPLRGTSLATHMSFSTNSLAASVLDGLDLMLFRDEKIEPVPCDRGRYVRDGELPRVIFDDPTTIVGDCGSVALARIGQSIYMAGFHVGTVKSEFGVIGVIEEITGGEIEKAIAQLRDAGAIFPSLVHLDSAQATVQGAFADVKLGPLPLKSSLNAAIGSGMALVDVLGTITPPLVGSSLKSRCYRTMFAGDFADLETEVCGKSDYFQQPPFGGRMVEVAGQKEWRDPYVVNLKGMRNQWADERVLDMCVKDYVDGMSSLAGWDSVKPLSDYEAWMGVECGDIGAINLKTSAGAPWFRRKEEFVKFDHVAKTVEVKDEILQHIERVLEVIDKGGVYSPLCCHSLKDEPLSQEKVDALKTRVFNTVPMAYNFLLKNELVLKHWALPVRGCGIY